MSSKKYKLLNLANCPELTPDYAPYPQWRFSFQNYVYGDSVEMGDMVVFTHNHPDKAQTHFTYDEARMRRAEEWSESSDEDEEEALEKKKLDPTTGTGTNSGSAASTGSKRRPNNKVRRALSRKAKADKEYAMMMRRLGLYLSVAFKAPILVTMCMTVADRNPISMLILVDKRYGGTDIGGHDSTMAKVHHV